MSKQNDQIGQLLTDDSFLRWINDEATPPEQQKWDRWLEEDPANIQLLREARELYRSLQFEEEQPNTTTQLHRLEEALDAEKKRRRKIPLTGKVRPKSYWMRAAAVIVLLVAVLVVIQFTGWSSEQQPAKEESGITFETVQTDYGETKKLTFSDGSQITLNAHSSLTYPTASKGGDMEVELEGEAYFSIVRKPSDRQRTFSVKTPEGKIAVLGTKFNVNTYSPNTEVVLEEGKVQLETSETSGSSGQAYTMSPSELVRLQSDNRKIEVLEKVDTELYTSWIGFELKFKNTPLRQIAKRVEQLYGTNVEFKEEDLKEVAFSGSAPNKNFAVLLEGLRTLLDIPIVHEGNTITFGG